MGTPVSGPGQFSQRTDKAVGEANRSLPDAGYGEQAQYQEQLQSAPIAKQDINASGMSLEALLGSAGAGVVGLGEPSSRVGTPITDGADAGAGAGLDSLNLPNQNDEDMQSILPYLPVLEFMANQPGASWAMRNTVRKAKAMRQ